jgi:NAD(P)-dependent dehydrogenase (short-subunit alcohol dehydrogenase family)
VDQLEGRVAVVTGAASGIGLAYARLLGSRGMHLVLADIEPDVLDEASRSVDAASVIAVVTDVSDAESVQALADRAFDAHPTVHVLCNNAGVSMVTTVIEATASDWQWMLGVNVWGIIHGIISFVPEMIRRGEPGHVVNTCSVASWTVSPGYGLYAATKHAAAAISEALAAELADSGAPIGVTAVCPSLVRTRLFSADRNRPAALGGADPGSEAEQARVDAFTENIQTPDEVAQSMLEAMREGRLWAFPNPDALQPIRDRFARVPPN